MPALQKASFLKGIMSLSHDERHQSILHNCRQCGMHTKFTEDKTLDSQWVNRSLPLTCRLYQLDSRVSPLVCTYSQLEITLVRFVYVCAFVYLSVCIPLSLNVSRSVLLPDSLSIGQCFCQSVGLSGSLSLFRSMFSFGLFSICLFLWVRYCVSDGPSVHQSLFPSIRHSVCLSIRQSVYLSVYLSIRHSVCLSVRQSVYLSIRHFVCLSVSVHQSFVWLIIPLSVSVSFPSTFCLSVFLDVRII